MFQAEKTIYELKNVVNEFLEQIRYILYIESVPINLSAPAAREKFSNAFAQIPRLISVRIEGTATPRPIGYANELDSNYDIHTSL